MHLHSLAAAVVMVFPVCAAAGPDIAERLAAADTQRGERIVSTQCAAACHTYDRDGATRVGPNLWDVVGRPMAQRKDYSYSQAMRERAGQGGVWTWAALDAYLAAPRKFVPGTSMTFVGLGKAKDRADVLLYLRSLSDDPEPLPDAG